MYSAMHVNTGINRSKLIKSGSSKTVTANISAGKTVADSAVPKSVLTNTSVYSKKSIRDQISSHLEILGESCLRIGNIQDNLFSFMNKQSLSDSPTVIALSYSLIGKEKSKIKDVIFKLLVAINMNEEALLLKKFWENK